MLSIVLVMATILAGIVLLVYLLDRLEERAFRRLDEEIEFAQFCGAFICIMEAYTKAGGTPVPPPLTVRDYFRRKETWVYWTRMAAAMCQPRLDFDEVFKAHERVAVDAVNATRGWENKDDVSKKQSKGD